MALVSQSQIVSRPFVSQKCIAACHWNPAPASSSRARGPSRPPVCKNSPLISPGHRPIPKVAKCLEIVLMLESRISVDMIDRKPMSELTNTERDELEHHG